MIAPPPTLHKPISTTDGNAQVGLCSHSGGWDMPRWRSSQFTPPNSGLSSDDHKIATATPLITYGRKMTVLKRLTPRRFMLSSSESPRPTIRYSGTEDTT